MFIYAIPAALALIGLIFGGLPGAVVMLMVYAFVELAVRPTRKNLKKSKK